MLEEVNANMINGANAGTRESLVRERIQAEVEYQKDMYNLKLWGGCALVGCFIVFFVINKISEIIKAILRDKEQQRMHELQLAEVKGKNNYGEAYGNKEVVISPILKQLVSDNEKNENFEILEDFSENNTILADFKNPEKNEKNAENPEKSENVA